MRPWLWIAAAVFVFLTRTFPAHADETALKPEAKAHLDQGLQLYEQKDYAGAIREFEQGYALEAAPSLLYALAQAERLGGQCARAVEHYQKFLESGPPPERESAARANLARCKDELAKEKPPEPERPVVAPPPAPPPTAAPKPPPPAPKPAPAPELSPWYSDVFGDVLVGTGTVALGAGAYFYLASKRNEDDARAAADTPKGGTYQSQIDRIERAERQRTISVITMSAGVGLIAGGILRYMLRDPEPAAPAVGAFVGPKGAGLAVGGRL